MKFLPRTSPLTATFAATLLLAAVAIPAHAQSIGGSPVSLAGGAPGSNADVAKRLELAGVAETLSPVKDALLTSNLASSPLFSQLMARMDIHRLDQQAALLMAQTFTAQELQALVAFLSSPAGRSITNKMPAYQKMLGGLMQNEFNAAFQQYSAQQTPAARASSIPVNPTLAPASTPAYSGAGTPLQR